MHRFSGGLPFSRIQPVGDKRRVDGLAAGSVDDVGVERVGQVPEPDQMIINLFNSRQKKYYFACLVYFFEDFIVSHLMRMSVPAVTTALRPPGLRMACMLVTLDDDGCKE